jgi:hypothetical protein
VSNILLSTPMISLSEAEQGRIKVTRGGMIGMCITNYGFNVESGTIQVSTGKSKQGKSGSIEMSTSSSIFRSIGNVSINAGSGVSGVTGSNMLSAGDML